jgi:hypothetical protein
LLLRSRRRTIDSLRRDADDVICVLTPTWLSSIGQWYDDFSATTDSEVRDLLARAAHRPGVAPSAAAAAPAGAKRAGDGRATGRDEEVIVGPAR